MTSGGHPGGTPDPSAWTQVAARVSGTASGFGPGYGAPSPRSDRTSTLAALSVVFAVVVAIAALVARPITTTVAGTAALPSAAVAPSSATTAPVTAPAPAVPADALPGFLLSLEEVKHLVNAPNLNEAKDDTKVFDVEEVTYSPPQCVTAFGAYELLLHDPAARAAGPMAIYDRSMRGPAPASGLLYLEETAVRVDGPSVARTFLAAVLDRWRRCAGHTVTSDGGVRGHMEIAVQQPITRGAVTTLRSNYINGVSLERAIAVKGNVTVDISATGKHADDEVNRLAQAIVDRIPG